MYTKPSKTAQQTMFFNLDSQPNHKHPLYLLANKIDWNLFEENFKKLYCENNGRPAKPIRRMVGLLILKHVRNVSDEDLVEQWQENILLPVFLQGAGKLVIGHLKADHRPYRNFYTDLFGNSINVMMSAAAFNYKRVMMSLLALLLELIPQSLDYLSREITLLFRIWQPAILVSMRDF